MKMKNNFNMIKTGFLLGIGTILAKATCMIIGGKIALASSKKALKKAGGDLGDTLINAFSKAVDEKVGTLDPATKAKFDEYTQKVTEKVKEDTNE